MDDYFWGLLTGFFFGWLFFYESDSIELKTNYKITHDSIVMTETSVGIDTLYIYNIKR